MSRRFDRYIFLFVSWGLAEVAVRAVRSAGFVFSFRQLTLPKLFGEFVERGGGALFLPPAFLDGLYFPGGAGRFRLLLAAAAFYGLCGFAAAFFPGGAIASAARRLPAVRRRFSPFTSPLFALLTCSAVAAVVRGHENVSMAPGKAAAYVAATAVAFVVSLVAGALLKKAGSAASPVPGGSSSGGTAPASDASSSAGSAPVSGASSSAGSASFKRSGPDRPPGRLSIFRRIGPGPAVLLSLVLLAFLVRAAAPPVALPRVGRFDPADPPPSIILIIIDTLRADHLGSYGYARAVSPFLDSLASTGIRFERAYSQAPWTSPSLMSIFTGTLPAMHRLDTTYRQGTRAAPMLPELLRQRGYHTIGLVSNLLAGAKFGFGRGFDVFDDTSVIYAPAEAVTDRAVSLLDKVPAEGPPIFFYILYFDPHMPYRPPAPYDKRFMGGYQGPATGSYDDMERLKNDIHGDPDALARMEALYDGEIAYLDNNLRGLFDKLKEMDLLDRGWVFITADHGEEFGEHGSLGHARTLYEEQLRVPLIVLPGEDAAGGAAFREIVRPDRPVSLVDLSVSILDIAGAARGEYIASVGLLETGSEEPGGPIFSETSRGDEELRAVIAGGYKYIHDSRRAVEHLYALEPDPAESNNISILEPEISETLRQTLLDAIDEARRTRVEFESGGSDLVPDRLTAREREALRSMGYIQ